MIMFLIPIPLHKQRFRERGFNQAELISQHINTLLQNTHHLKNRVEIKKNYLSRRINTPQQAQMRNDMRDVNVLNAFTAHLPKKNKKGVYVLIDDVCTTGATMRAAADALQKSPHFSPEMRICGISLAD